MAVTAQMFPHRAKNIYDEEDLFQPEFMANSPEKSPNGSRYHLPDFGSAP
jgi:hypothetical protein